MIMVRFFDTVAKRAGRDSLEVDCTQGMTLQDLVGQLKLLYPGALLSISAVAVNGMCFRDMSLPLEDGWEIVFMYP